MRLPTQAEVRRFRGTGIHQLILGWLRERREQTKDLAVSQDPRDPINFAAAQGVYCEYTRLVESFDDDLLQYLTQEEEKYGRESDDD